MDFFMPQVFTTSNRRATGGRSFSAYEEAPVSFTEENRSARSILRQPQPNQTCYSNLEEVAFAGIVEAKAPGGSILRAS
jgi:hypothetical protein